MPDHFSKKVAEILRIIERREHEKLQDASLDVPLKFNWIRDVFEPLITTRYGARNMLELVTDDGSLAITYQQAILKCNQF